MHWNYIPVERSSKAVTLTWNIFVSGKQNRICCNESWLIPQGSILLIPKTPLHQFTIPQCILTFSLNVLSNVSQDGPQGHNLINLTAIAMTSYQETSQSFSHSICLPTCGALQFDTLAVHPLLSKQEPMFHSHTKPKQFLHNAMTSQLIISQSLYLLHWYHNTCTLTQLGMKAESGI